MKKFVMLVAMVMMLTVSAVCSASSGSTLDAEEAMVNKFLTSANYKAVVSQMTENMKKDWDEKAYGNFKEQVGKITLNKLRIVQKLDDADILEYQVVSDKLPRAGFQFVFLFNGDKPVMERFGVAVPQPKEEEKAAEGK